MHRYIINIFQSAGLKEEEEKKISFLHFYMNDIYNDVCRYSISSVKRGTITISRDSNEERSGAIPPSTKKLLLRRNIRLSQKFFFFFRFSLYTSVSPRFRSIVSTYLDDTLSFIKYYIR